VGAGQPQFIRIPGEPDREYSAFLPESLQADAEPLVLVHGISRNAAELVMRFADMASRFGVPLIAPLFRRESHGQYQQAVDPRSGLRSDLALCDILTDAARRFGIETGKVALFGFSGGAQFVHRFSLIHPGRVRVCVPASAGWYTMPDTELAWPLGLADMPGGAIDPAARTIPFHLIVGQRDTQGDDALRRNPELDRLQGTDRRSRAKTWDRALRRAGWSAGGSLTVLPRTRHNFACADRHGLTQTVFRLLGYEGTEE
jgi:pimeloyl-ACP methyl ester carboxylesterase